MRCLRLLLVLLAATATPVALQVSTAAAAGVGPSGPESTQLLAFRGHFGGFHLGGSRYGRSRFGGGVFGRRAATRGLFRRIARALAFAYIFHLLFSHGGISLLIWLIVIGLLFHLFRRRRRRRDRYAY